MSIFADIYHGRDKNQCYNEPACLVCYVRVTVQLLSFRHRVKQAVREGRIR